VYCVCGVCVCVYECVDVLKTNFSVAIGVCVCVCVCV